MTIKYPHIGEKYGLLTVVSGSIFRTKNKSIGFLCRCECGSERVYDSHTLRNGNSKSCGCKRQENFYKAWEEYYASHPSIEILGLKSTYSSWTSMKYRCLNPNAAGYKDYGGRGITVCERWLESFQNFLDDMGERPDGLSIGRKDNNGNYEPNNCQWETDKQKANNTRRTKKIDGIPLSYKIDELGIEDKSLIRSRVFEGWSFDDAISAPKFQPKSDIKSGDRFGRLVVVSNKPDHIICNSRERSSGIKKYQAFRCRCDCGIEVLVPASKLRNGKRKSCGCLAPKKPLTL